MPRVKLQLPILSKSLGCLKRNKELLQGRDKVLLLKYEFGNCPDWPTILASRHWYCTIHRTPLKEVGVEKWVKESKNGK
jgi:hypothetical protein